MTEHEIRARVKKVMSLADLARLEGHSAKDLEHFGPAERVALASRAGVNPPSEASWNLLVQTATKLERHYASDPYQGRPFDRFPQ